MNCGKTTVKAPFPWSFGRERLLDWCPRAFYYQYYLAQSGFDQHADDNLKRLYRLKHLQPIERWPDSVAGSALREFFHAGFYRDGTHPIDALYRLAERRLARGKGSVANELWREDPKLLNLQEVYYGQRDILEIFNAAEEKLRETLAVFTGSELFVELCSLDQLAWRNLPLPCSFTLGEIQVWLSPTLVWQSRRRLGFLQFSSGKNMGEIAALHKLFAATLNMSPENTITHFLNAESGSITTLSDDRINISATIDRVKAGAATMPQPSGSFEKDFLKNVENCSNCRFREYCANEL